MSRRKNGNIFTGHFLPDLDLSIKEADPIWSSGGNAGKLFLL